LLKKITRNLVQYSRTEKLQSNKDENSMRYAKENEREKTDSRRERERKVGGEI
jgi:hypothetical protein